MPKIHPTIVIDVVGLTHDLMGEYTPHINRLSQQGEYHPLATILPATTCPVQATLLTGLLPTQHGCVANGWYFRDLCEIWFWRQSNKLVRGEKVWEAARKIAPECTCANLFWWYNMYSSVDVAVTPRPIYLADGRKIPDIYTQPADLREQLTQRLGRFPLFHFWGPQADIVSSTWIAQAACYVHAQYHPSLMLIYLPHLDYNLQRLGPTDPALSHDLIQIDRVCGELIDYFSNHGYRIILLSEYGMHAVTDAVHINRLLRAEGFISIREELGRELLDPGASRAFAVADHQIAHVYVRNQADILPLRRLLENTPGIAQVLDQQEQQAEGLAHERSGELLALSACDRWFSYYYWHDDACAPDFARTVDIHRKPGYDPVELFIDPRLRWPRLTIAWKLAKKYLGWRSLLDVIGLDTRVVKGSHGRITATPDQGPVFLTSTRGLIDKLSVSAAEVKGLILDHLFRSC